MAVIATIRIPEPKIRKNTTPARRIFIDRKRRRPGLPAGTSTMTRSRDWNLVFGYRLRRIPDRQRAVA